MLFTNFKSVGTGNCKAALVVSMIAPRWGRVDKGGRLLQHRGQLQRTRDWIVYADLDLDSHAKEDKAGLLLGRFEFSSPPCLHIFAHVDWLMMSDQFSSPICQSYLKHMYVSMYFPFLFNMFRWFTSGI